MLLSKDAIADVLEQLRPGDFYRPPTRTSTTRSWTSTAAASPPTRSPWPPSWTAAGLLRRVGGAPYLHTLISTVPTAANAGYYAGIVAEKALLRRLVEAGTRVVQYGYAGADGADVAEIVDRAQAEIYDVTERRARPKTSWRWKSCCSRRWTRSTPSPPRAGSRAACRRGSPNSTR